MSTCKLDTSGAFESVQLKSSQTTLSLPAEAVRFRSNGIEFRSARLIPSWKEMSVELQSPTDGSRIQCTGVVVACNGNRHTGYAVSMVLMNLSPQSQHRLDQLAFAGWA